MANFEDFKEILSDLQWNSLVGTFYRKINSLIQNGESLENFEKYRKLFSETRWDSLVDTYFQKIKQKIEEGNCPDLNKIQFLSKQQREILENHFFQLTFSDENSHEFLKKHLNNIKGMKIKTDFINEINILSQNIGKWEFSGDTSSIFFSARNIFNLKTIAQNRYNLPVIIGASGQGLFD